MLILSPSQQTFPNYKQVYYQIQPRERLNPFGSIHTKLGSVLIHLNDCLCTLIAYDFLTKRLTNVDWYVLYLSIFFHFVVDEIGCQLVTYLRLKLARLK